MNYIEDIKMILKNEGVVILVGYIEKDVNVGVFKFYDKVFDIMFFCFLKEISMGLYMFYLIMFYRKDMIFLYKEFIVFM